MLLPLQRHSYLSLIAREKCITYTEHWDPTQVKLRIVLVQYVTVFRSNNQLCNTFAKCETFFKRFSCYLVMFYYLIYLFSKQ